MNIYKWRFLPAFIGLALIGAYIFSNQAFVKCSSLLTNCKEIESGNISQIPNPGKNDLKTIAATLDDKKRAYDEKNGFVKTQNEAIENTKKEINENLKLQNLAALTTPTPTPSIDLKKLENSTAEKPAAATLKSKGEELKVRLTNQELDLQKYLVDAAVAEKEVQDIRRQVSARYSSRLMFMFLTAAFALLCLAAIAVSIISIKIALDPAVEKNTPFAKLPKTVWIWAGLTALAAFIFIELVDNFFANEYLAIVIPIYRQTISGSGDVSFGLIHFFNLLGFGTIIFLVGASSLLFYAVSSKRQAGEELPVLETERKDKLIEKEVEEAKAADKDELKINKLTTEISELDRRIEDLTKNVQDELADKNTLKSLIEEKDSINLPANLPALEKKKADKLAEKTTEEQKTADKDEAKILRLTDEINNLDIDIGAKKNRLGEIELRIVVLTAKIKERFEPYKRCITAILYVGAGMLFVGMLRVKLLADWHLIFVSNDKSNANYILLADFFKNSITVQAGFYSIFLALIYLPVFYALPSADTLPTEPPKNIFEKIGLPLSSEFIAKFAAVFSPVLAGPVVEFFNYLVGKTG